MFAVFAVFFCLWLPGVLAFFPAGIKPNIPTIPSSNNQESPGTVVGNVPNAPVNPVDNSPVGSGSPGNGATLDLTITKFNPMVGKAEKTEEHFDDSEGRVALLNTTMSELEVRLEPITPCDCVAPPSDKDIFDSLNEKFIGLQSPCSSQQTLNDLQASVDGVQAAAASIDQSGIDMTSVEINIQDAQLMLSDISMQSQDPLNQIASEESVQSLDQDFLDAENHFQTTDVNSCLSNCQADSALATKEDLAEIQANYGSYSSGVDGVKVGEVESKATELDTLMDELHKTTLDWEEFLTEKNADLAQYENDKTDLSAQITDVEGNYDLKATVANAADIPVLLTEIKAGVESNTIDDPATAVEVIIKGLESKVADFLDTQEVNTLLDEVKEKHTTVGSLSDVDISQVSAPSGTEELDTAITDAQTKTETVTSDLENALSDAEESGAIFKGLLERATDVKTGVETLEDGLECPGSFTYLEDVNMCISITMQDLNWFEAFSECKHRGGSKARLAVLDTDRKRSAFVDFKDSQYIWDADFLIGFHTMSPGNGWSTYTDYTWVDRWEWMDYWNGQWNSGEPNSMETGCGNLWDNYLDDVNCFEFTAYSVCEVPMKYMDLPEPVEEEEEEEDFWTDLFSGW